jgi:predicted Zn-dependent peptidase
MSTTLKPDKTTFTQLVMDKRAVNKTIEEIAEELTDELQYKVSIHSVRSAMVNERDKRQEIAKEILTGVLEEQIGNDLKILEYSQMEMAAIYAEARQEGDKRLALAAIKALASTTLSKLGTAGAKETTTPEATIAEISKISNDLKMKLALAIPIKQIEPKKE